ARPLPDDLATFLSIRFNQAVLKQDLSQLFEIDSLNKDQAQAARHFLQQHPVSAKELSEFWASSQGSVVILKYQKKAYRIDLSTLDQHKVTISGRTVKASPNINEIAKSIDLAFPEYRKRAWSPFQMSPAWAQSSNPLKSVLSAVVFAGYGTDNLGPEALLGVILQPHDPGEWIVESFDCQKDGKIAWTALGLSAAFRNGRIKSQSFSYLERPNPKYKTVLEIQGMNCEASPYYKDGEWTAVTDFENTDLFKACQKQSQSSDSDCKVRVRRLQDHCDVQAQKYGFIQKCCAKAGCEAAVKEKIEGIKRSSAKEYNQINPSLRSDPGAK
ncbi:MAG: hypothetical protein ACXWC9_09425, partial [Pseudobdellovibrionaceae bacterium]